MAWSRLPTAYATLQLSAAAQAWRSAAVSQRKNCTLQVSKGCLLRGSRRVIVDRRKRILVNKYEEADRKFKRRLRAAPPQCIEGRSHRRELLEPARCAFAVGRRERQRARTRGWTRRRTGVYRREGRHRAATMIFGSCSRTIPCEVHGHDVQSSFVCLAAAGHSRATSRVQRAKAHSTRRRCTLRRARRVPGPRADSLRRWSVLAPSVLRNDRAHFRGGWVRRLGR